jgi:hypothetical protein
VDHERLLSSSLLVLSWLDEDSSYQLTVLESGPVYSASTHLLDCHTAHPGLPMQPAYHPTVLDIADPVSRHAMPCAVTGEMVDIEAEQQG